MSKTNFPFKVALGYAIAVIVLVLALSLVYSNTTSILTINQASREYIKKRNSADSVMSNLLKEEQRNLKELSNAIGTNVTTGYLQKKVDSLNNGKDSVVVQSRKEQTHAAQNTTVEVIKRKKGFFKRLADAFKKEYAETLSVRHDSSIAVVDTLASPINVANEVADILKQIDKQEKKHAKGKDKVVTKEMKDLQMANAQLAVRSAQQINSLHQQERMSMEQSINQAINARQHLLEQIALLAVITLVSTLVLFVYIWRDNKKERMYRENLERANDETQRIMRQRERLLLTITHDIKAPAASISGFIDLVRDYVSDEKGVSCLENIKSSADHLAALVAELLDYHQLENGSMELKPVSFSPALLVRQCVDAHRVLAERKGIVMSSCLKESPYKSASDGQGCGTDAICRADAFRIRQILNNLVSNAVKYTDAGSIMITASLRRVSQEKVAGNHNILFVISVKDTGRGMKTEDKSKVFQPFTRLDNAQGIEGTGLGLSVAHELVLLLGGQIELVSTVGKGSEFTVSIPLEEVLGNVSTSEQGEQTGKSKEVSCSNRNAHYANNKILILDDDKLQLQLIQEMLSRVAGNTWQVYSCNKISEALTLLHSERPALMFMDIEMPEMSGMELIKHINHSNMTVIAMTAHDDSFRTQIEECGFDGCLFKPFSTESIANILGVPYVPSAIVTEKSALSAMLSREVNPFLAFAAGDADAEKEIMNTMKESVRDFLEAMHGMLLEHTVPRDGVGKLAHRLLPVATMLKMSHTEEIKELSPEHIVNHNDEEVRRYMDLVIAELQLVLDTF